MKKRSKSKITYWINGYETRHGKVKRRPNSSCIKTFLRLNNRRSGFTGKDFAKAGYPSAMLDFKKGWSEVHDWCKEKFAYPKDYTWTGSMFWFLTKEDKDLFVAEWVMLLKKLKKQF